MENVVTAEALENFIAMAQGLVLKSEGPTYPENCRSIIRAMTNGRKYIRVTRCTGGSDTDRSAFCFIRKSDGAVLKTANWKSPAKGVRGSVFADNPREAGITAYGAVYFR